MNKNCLLDINFFNINYILILINLFIFFFNINYINYIRLEKYLLIY